MAKKKMWSNWSLKIYNYYFLFAEPGNKYHGVRLKLILWECINTIDIILLKHFEVLSTMSTYTEINLWFKY